MIPLLEKTLESPLDCKEIKSVNPKGKQPWLFIGRTAAKAEASILQPPDVKSGFTGEDPDAGKDWGQEEKGVAENEIVEWHHQLNVHEFEHTLGYSRKQRSLACCSSWGYKELDTTERLNNRLQLVFFFPSSLPPSLSSLFLFPFSLSFLLALLISHFNRSF